MAGSTETLTITLPKELLENIRARVVKGSYSSDNDLILHDLQEAAAWDSLPKEPLGSLEDIFAEIPAQIARGSCCAAGCHEERVSCAVKRFRVSYADAALRDVHQIWQFTLEKSGLANANNFRARILQD